MLGELFIAFGKLSEEREDFIGREGLQLAFPEMLAEFRDDGVVGSEGIFVSNGGCGSRSNTGLPGRPSWGTSSKGFWGIYFPRGLSL
jgi:hypothetical protein